MLARKAAPVSRPGVGKSRAAAQVDVLDGKEEFPERRDLGKFSPRRQGKVDGQNDEVRRQDAQGAAQVETFEINRSIPRQTPEQLSADQVTAQNKKQIDANQPKRCQSLGRANPENPGVVNDYHDNGQSTEQIETRLPLPIREARIDGQGRLAHGCTNSRTLAGPSLGQSIRTAVTAMLPPKQTSTSAPGVRWRRLYSPAKYNPLSSSCR